MNSINPAINEIHAKYCQLTGYDVALHYGRERVWHDYLKRFNADDLALCIQYLKGRIAARVRHPECLKLNNLVGDYDRLDLFEEDLAIARANMRKRQSDARDRVLAQAGRPPAEPDNVRKVDEVMANKAFQDFIKSKQAL